ncbi:MAG: SsrA-binding protein SmpB [Candidatus Hydrothermales bacterium]
MKSKRERDILLNKKVKSDYEIFETFICGVVLKGAEVKSLREGRASISDAYVKFEDGEPYIYNFYISPYPPAFKFFPNPERKKKLLLTRREIKRLIGKWKEKGLVLIPVRVFFKGSWAKIELALAKKKKKYEKKELIKKREIERELKREMLR